LESLVVKYFSDILVLKNDYVERFLRNKVEVLILLAEKCPQIVRKNWKQIDNRIRTLDWKTYHEDDPCGSHTDHRYEDEDSLRYSFPPYPFDD
jgi:hypothetical protein